MRHLLTAVIVITITLLLMAVTPADTINQQRITGQHVVYSDDTVNLRILQTDGLSGVRYYVAGAFVECDSVLSVRSLLLGDSADSVAVTGAPIERVSYATGDSCAVEAFLFGLHGGAARKIIEHAGLAELVVICRSGAIRFPLSEMDERELIRLFGGVQTEI